MPSSSETSAIARYGRKKKHYSYLKKSCNELLFMALVSLIRVNVRENEVITRLLVPFSSTQKDKFLRPLLHFKSNKFFLILPQKMRKKGKIIVFCYLGFFSVRQKFFFLFVLTE